MNKCQSTSFQNTQKPKNYGHVQIARNYSYGTIKAGGLGKGKMKIVTKLLNSLPVQKNVEVFSLKMKKEEKWRNMIEEPQRTGMFDEPLPPKKTGSRYRSPDAMQKAWDEFMVEHADLLRELASR